MEANGDTSAGGEGPGRARSEPDQSRADSRPAPPRTRGRRDGLRRVPVRLLGPSGRALLGRPVAAGEPASLPPRRERNVRRAA